MVSTAGPSCSSADPPPSDTVAGRESTTALDRVARFVLLLLPVLFAGISLFLPHDSAGAERAGSIVFNGTFVAAVAVGALRVRKQRGSTDHRAWLLLTCALALFLAGNIASHFGDFLDYPSLSDALWLSFYVFTYCAIVAFAGVRNRSFRPAAWLDGATAGAGAAALVSALALAPVMSITGGTWIVVATNIAYPAADLLLIFMLGTTAYLTRDLQRSWLLLVVGLTAFTVGDIIFLTTVAETGTWPTLSPWNLLWVAGVALMGLAASLPPTSRPQIIGTSGRQLIPLAFVVAVVALLVYGQQSDLPAVAVGLAVLTLAGGILRLLWTIREVQILADSRQEARVDFLTGLPNRRSFSEFLTAATTGSGPTALLVVDLDRFNEVNDSLGHAAGDELLRAVGQRLSAAVPRHGHLSRLGGDEFAFVLTGATVPEATTFADLLLATFQEPFDLQGLRIPVSAAAGLATLPDHAATGSDLFAAADIALYQAKRDHLPWAVYRDHQANPSRQRLELLADLRTALDTDQFSVHFQPQLELSTGTVIGVEALVRWAHPVHGWIPPHQFLDLLTMSNLMPPFTRVMLRKSLAARRILTERGHDLSVSVNISAADLVGNRLPVLVADLLVEFDVAAGRLVLEITEDAVISDRLGSRRTLQELKAAGARVSVDDYGTGQASLGYLRDLPLDELKLDRSFLVDVDSDPHNAAIVRSTVELAHSLDLPIVAEGVEYLATLTWLGSIGCDVAQGFHIARPQPLGDLLAWLDDRTPTTPRRALAH